MHEIKNISISTGTMIRAGLVGLGFFLIWFLRDFILIILTSIVIASFIESAIPFFKKFKINRVFSVIILYIFALSILGGIFYLFAPFLLREIHDFSILISQYVPNSPFLNYFQSDIFSGAKNVITDLSQNFSLKTFISVSENFVKNISGGFFQTLSVAFGNFFNLILILVISFYLSIEEKGIEKFLRIIIPIEYEDHAVDLWERSRRKIALWIKGQVILGILVAILIYLILSLLQVEYALILALIAGIMDLVPYGTILALIPAVVISYASGGFASAGIVAVAYLIINQFEIFLFAPVIIEKVVGLSPLVIIFAAIIGFEFSSFWGLILAIPVAVFVMELMSDLEKNKIILRSEKNKICFQKVRP